MRQFARAALFACLLPGGALLPVLVPAGAQAQSYQGQSQAAAPSAQTLEDIRRNLQSIDAEVQALRAQLVDSGARMDPAQGNPMARLDSLERNVRILTGRVEQIQHQVRGMAEDAGRRYSDVEFRLTEIEGGDAALLGDPVPLGGAGAGFGAGTAAGQGTGTGAPQVAVAVSEQNAYDAARRQLDAGDYAGAARAFQGFLDSYPDSPLKGDAGYYMGEALLADGQFRAAAKGYLGAFNAAPGGSHASEALYGVGISLMYLGQYPEACLTFDEVARRFPDLSADMREKLARGREGASCS